MRIPKMPEFTISGNTMPTSRSTHSPTNDKPAQSELLHSPLSESNPKSARNLGANDESLKNYVKDD